MLLKKWVFYLLAFISIAAPLIFFIYGFSLYYEAALLAGEDIHFRAEEYLFFFILVIVGIFFVYVIAAGYSIRIFKELDKAAALLRGGSGRLMQRDALVNILRRTGRLGKKVQEMNRTLDELNQAKSLRISALNSLVDIILKQEDSRIIVFSISGKITHCSSGMLEKSELKRADLLEKSITDFVKDISPRNLVSELDKKKAELVYEKIELDKALVSYMGKVTFVPVYNSANNLSDVMMVLGDFKYEGSVEWAGSMGMKGISAQRQKPFLNFFRRKDNKNEGKG
jgi:PAS domain-containing protein